MSIGTLRRYGMPLTLLAALVCAECSAGRNSVNATPEASWNNSELDLASRLMIGKGVTKDPAAGAALTERLAQGGNPLAQLLIGEYYFSGTGVQKNVDTAVGWIQKAAQQSLPTAQAELAFIYMRGVGVQQDYARALELAKAAAAKDNPEGEDALGIIYLNGFGVPTDEPEAVKWFRKAAQRKYSSAMMHFGELYRDGRGVEFDRVVAYAWFSLSAANANSPAQRQAAAKTRDDLALAMLPADLAIAQQIASEWKPGDDLVAKRRAAAGSLSKAPVELAKNSGSLVLTGADAATGPSKDSADLPIIVKQLSYDYEVTSDGAYTATIHTETLIKTEAALREFGQDTLYFSDSTQTVDVVEAHTLKADGRKLAVAPSAVHVQLAPGNPNVPMFDDQRQKVIVFPNLEAGDVTVSTVRYTSKPAFEGFFSVSLPFNRAVPYELVSVTIKIPKSMPLLTETHDMRFEQRSSGDRLIYEWHYTNNNPLRESYIALDPRDRWPRLFASSFRNHEQFAAAYWAAIESKIAVTPAIQKLADEITQGISDRRRQAEAIYNWVSRRIRYVAVEIGRGAYIPHDADVALSNGYGDCKDKAVLFSALLKAKGIASNVVLINQGVSFTLPTPPIFGTLNHAITWIPEFNLYADSTGGVAPFGMLSLLEYGKPVVHATATAPAIHRTPTLPANSASITLKTKARLSPDGKIAGESEASAVGPLSISLREDAVSIQSAGLEQAAKQQLRSRGYEGIGKFEFTSPFDPASTYRIAGHFETNPRPEILAGNSFYVPLGLAIGPVPGDLLMGRLNFIDPRGDEPTPCFSGHEIEELSLEIPEGRRLRDLPKGKEIKNKYLHFKSEWSFAGRTVTVRREFTSTIDQPLCIGESRRLAAKALNEIRGDYTTAVTLADK